MPHDNTIRPARMMGAGKLVVPAGHAPPPIEADQPADAAPAQDNAMRAALRQTISSPRRIREMAEGMFDAGNFSPVQALNS